MTTPSEVEDTDAATALESADVDERVLILRSQSEGFAKIAQTLGLGRASVANEAFNRALRRRPSDEQATIRSAENRRLDRLADAVRANGSRTEEDVDKRMRAIERLRSRLMQD